MHVEMHRPQRGTRIYWGELEIYAFLKGIPSSFLSARFQSSSSEMSLDKLNRLTSILNDGDPEVRDWFLRRKKNLVSTDRAIQMIHVEGNMRNTLKQRM